MKHSIYTLLLAQVFIISSCSSSGQGQVIYHWERENTGVAKFSRDHSECLKEAESWFQWPNISNWFYSEEYRYDIHVDWYKEKGIWASYVPHRGAQPLLINSIRDNSTSDPKTYRLCMEKKGYWHRQYDIPSVTNVYVYRPQRPEDTIPFGKYNYY